MLLCRGTVKIIQSFFWNREQQVSDEGDVLYVLPKDYRANLTSKSLRMKYEPLLEKLKVSLIHLAEPVSSFSLARIPHFHSK